MFQFKLLRTLLGIPIFLIGNCIAHTWFPIGYFIGAMIGLVGTALTAKVFNCKLDGIEAVVIAIPLYFYSSLPNSYMWTQGWFDLSTIMIIRIIMSFIGGVWIFSSTDK